MSGKVKSFFLAIALLVLFIAAYLYINKDSLSELEVDYKISANELYEEYSDNKSRANDKYLNKILEVTGTIDQTNIVSDNALDPVIEVTDPHLTLKTSESSGNIFCTFKQDIRLDPVPLKNDDIISVIGICKGFILSDVHLTKCELVEPASK